MCGSIKPHFIYFDGRRTTIVRREESEAALEQLQSEDCSGGMSTLARPIRTQEGDFTQSRLGDALLRAGPTRPGRVAHPGSA